ncbi:hypothetical protein [Amycolatopsis sp. VC5-11]|uniref:hypothetical protein n=1 Tax=Amycolatopsis sp. VC5-11 TaxID=3120156 RepID=UPI00300A04C6
MTAVMHDTASPLAQAMQLHAFLLGGGQLGPVADLPGTAFDPGEYTVTRLDSGLGYARLCTAAPQAVPVQSGGVTVMVGDPAYVAGFALGATLRSTMQHRAIRRACTPQWRSQPLVATALTTRRLWTDVLDGGQVKRHWANHEMVTDIRLAGDRLELYFARGAPLSLTGPWAPWCAALIAHYRYGTRAAAVLPSLNSVLPYR